MLGTKVLSVHGVGDPNGPDLEILETAQGGPKDEQGEVVFVARFRDKEGLRSHHERGQFKRKRGRWLFTEGIMVKSKPLTVNKIGRNDPCSCGSGSSSRSAAAIALFLSKGWRSGRSRCQFLIPSLETILFRQNINPVSPCLRLPFWYQQHLRAPPSLTFDLSATKMIKGRTIQIARPLVFELNKTTISPST
jgi:hypothetical protein